MDVRFLFALSAGFNVILLVFCFYILSLVNLNTTKVAFLSLSKNNASPVIEQSTPQADLQKNTSSESATSSVIQSSLSPSVSDSSFNSQSQGIAISAEETRLLAEEEALRIKRERSRSKELEKKSKEAAAMAALFAQSSAELNNKHIALTSELNLGQSNPIEQNSTNEPNRAALGSDL